MARLWDRMDAMARAARYTRSKINKVQAGFPADAPGKNIKAGGEFAPVTKTSNDLAIRVEGAGGKLAIAAGDEIIAVINRYIADFESDHLPVLFTRDWHPPKHQSFVSQGGPWPEHCVAGSGGAEFAALLRVPEKVHIISTGMQADQQGYSGFENPCFNEILQRKRIQRLFIGGLATEYCVLYTVREALKLKYQVFLLKDAIRAVNRRPNDGIDAEQEMQARGAQLIIVDDIL